MTSHEPRHSPRAFTLGAMVAVWCLSAPLTPMSLLGTSLPDSELGIIEDAYARSPSSRPLLSGLVRRYLDRSEPGLALAALSRAPPEAKDEPEILHLRARAAFDEGSASEALRLEREVLETCGKTVCPPRLIGGATLRVAFFDALVEQGTEDPAADAGAVRTAYIRSSRQVRLASVVW